ncbi:ABC transporter substrate-binding protein [Piscinibacter terrae]|uniref:Amino acid ABC transporter substrate-binding protein n=1 Tax=Piscinibacter terrae TaxID=2496871 RepID=A0A3N7HQQ7_9BURK|nr:ABC transporter substrate-binding protein [Albitalea terrae]RQP24578.1 amino acid ABC transporter substrate-binding protein [Albitalea terrae]
MAGLNAAALADIKVGQTAGISGAVAASVKEATIGAKLYFDAVNARGGVHGEAIQLISLDDKFDPKLAAANAKTLIDQGVIALFLNRGTPHTQAIMPLLTEHKVPLVGPSTGAMVLHQPVHPWLFNVRATYQREAERAVAHLSLIGIDRMAIVQVDDTFGADAVQGALRGMRNVDKQPVAHEKYDRSKPDFVPIMPRIIAANPQAVLFIGSGTAVVDGMKALRAAGSRAQMVTLSNNASAGFIKDLGELSHGVVISQVFPYERSIASPLVKEVMELSKAANLELTPTMIEGYASAKVLVEGLRRAGPQPTRDKLRKALESMTRFDLGGVELGYSPTDHTGLDYADLAIVGPDGKFRR